VLLQGMIRTPGITQEYSSKMSDYQGRILNIYFLAIKHITENPCRAEELATKAARYNVAN
jgi:hypothetical protein